MPQGAKVDIKAAKGRPMLTWVGKKPLRHVTAFPAQLIETFSTGDSTKYKPKSEIWSDWLEKYTQGGLLFHGDNKEILAYLLTNGFRGKVKLIYIDPPFNTGVNYVRRIVLRNINHDTKIEAEGYSFAEQIQYSTNWSDDVFLQFLYERLQLLKEILHEDGAIFIRMDVKYGHYIKLIGDEVFGKDCFVNELIINRIQKNVTNQGKLSIPNAVDHLYVFSSSPVYSFVSIKRHLQQIKPGYWRAMDSAEVRPNPERIIEGRKFYPPPGRHFTFTQSKIDEMYKQGKIRLHPQNGKPEYWVEERESISLDTDWTDISGYTFTTGYPTENSESLLERVINIASSPGDIVLDSFIGSGTTAAVAQKSGRRWIGCDINKGAIQTTSKRLQEIMKDQAKKLKKESAQVSMEIEQDTKKIKPTQLSFSVYRVNDYDLQIQHNEAVNMACEHIGIERSHADSFFDGRQDKRLVKIIPFGHPLTPVDLEEIKKELEARPEEDRDILVVCLGKEFAVEKWLEDWNRLRSRGDVPNKIEVIELRTDPKYGKFMEHKPTQARVDIRRDNGKIVVEILDFISPTIIERLSQQAGILQPQIDDWRSMVDTVMIDPAYNGEVFNICLSDVPEKKTDLVVGKYEIPAPEGHTTVAVKITDMLGEECTKVLELAM